MIQEARRVAEALNIPAEFYVMDAETPSFPPDSFDVIVTRNLTWGLPHLQQTYRNWYTLLSEQGLPDDVILHPQSAYAQRLVDAVF